MSYGKNESSDLSIFYFPRCPIRALTALFSKKAGNWLFEDALKPEKPTWQEASMNFGCWLWLPEKLIETWFKCIPVGLALHPMSLNPSIASRFPHQLSLFMFMHPIYLQIPICTTNTTTFQSTTTSSHRTLQFTLCLIARKWNLWMDVLKHESHTCIPLNFGFEMKFCRAIICVRKNVNLSCWK